MALAHLQAAGVPWDLDLPPVAACPELERRVLARQLETGLACVPTSSAGRLFDAVSSLAGVRHEVGYEAQAAMELQALAAGPLDRDGLDLDVAAVSYELPLRPPEVPGGPLTWDVGTLVRAVVADVRAGEARATIAARFHRGLAAAVVDVATRAAVETGHTRVALSGGVFCNALLLRLVSRGLREAGLEVLRHSRVPPNDGGLALGQVVVGSRRLSVPVDVPAGK
jgi:hydrogenase maturation protein HypF